MIAFEMIIFARQPVWGIDSLNRDENENKRNKQSTHLILVYNDTYFWFQLCFFFNNKLTIL